jgi:ADP-ribosylglycohydrolase
MKENRNIYFEPAEYFQKNTRQKYRIGEYYKVLTRGKIEYIVKSIILGHAVGDALGVPVEFCDRKKLDDNPVVDMRGFGTYPYPAGTWSDDTSMSLCALEAMTRDDWNTSTVMENFVKWLNDGEFTPTGECFDVGRTCFDAIMNYHIHKLPPRECGGQGEHSNGNGSLMRIHPFVLYGYAKKIRDFDWLALIDTASALTHAHERSKIACLIYGTVFNFIMMEPTKDKVREGIKFACDDFDHMDEFLHYSRLADPNFEHLSRDEI